MSVTDSYYLSRILFETCATTHGITNDILHNETQYNDVQHNDTQHNDTQHNGRMLSYCVFYADCRIC
jgi:hypothetical protein